MPQLIASKNKKRDQALWVALTQRHSHLSIWRLARQDGRAKPLNRITDYISAALHSIISKPIHVK